MEVVENKLASSLVVFLGKALNETSPTSYGRQVAEFPSEKWVGRASDCETNAMKKNADQKLSAVATPNRKKAEKQQHC